MFTQRSNEKELIDLGPDFYSQDEYKQCMQKLFTVNRLLGFFHSTVKLLKKIPQVKTIVDIGCGNGSFILNLSKYFPYIQFTGLDISSEAIYLAQQELQKQTHSNSQVSFTLQQQATLALPENSVDVMLATLVCHHLEDKELIEFLRQTYAAARKMVVINDLHRNFLAYALYALICPVLFRNRLLTHDGLISIKRGFKRKDWKLLLNAAEIKHYRIKWCFPFRWRIILWKE